MNKQEAIGTIEQDKIQVGRFTEITREVNAIQRKIEMVDYVPLETVVSVIDKIDEPQKVAVPKFVAEWIDEMKQDERPLYSVISGLMNKTNHEWTVWKSANMNFSETIAKAWLDGCEIEQEKLYTVEIPNPNGDSNRYGLCKVDGKIIVGSFVFGLDRANNAKLTESEIKQDFDFLWQFAKEVE